MGFLTSDNSPRTKIEEAEEQIAGHLRELIRDEEGHLEKLAEIEQNQDEVSVEKAKEALRSIGIAVQEDLDEVEDQELKIQDALENPDLQVQEEFRRAADHNLELLEEMTAAIDQEDSNLGQWLSAVDEDESIEAEAEDLIGIEEKLSEDLERIKSIMNNGETEFTDRQGWIDLSQFN